MNPRKAQIDLKVNTLPESYPAVKMHKHIQIGP